MYLVYSIFPNKDEAGKVAMELVQEKLIACANIIPGLTSIYEWEGLIRQDEEVIMICKVSNAAVENIIKLVSRKHSYSCPCVVAIEVQKGNKDFMKWVETCCNLDY